MKLKFPLAATLLVAVLVAGGCKSPASNTPPAGHTVNKSGVYHRPGLTDPMTNCVQCHGADLRGGSGPSCYSCHGQKW